MKIITVELTGLAGTIAGAQVVSFKLPEDASYRDILRQLAERFPGLVGILIAEDRESFLSSNMFVINGDLETTAMVLDKKPVNNEVIHLMSVITGG